MTEKEAAAVLYSINDLYPHVKTTPEAAKNRAALWASALKPYKVADVVQAVKLHISTSSFYPQPHDIIELLPRACMVIDTQEPAALDSGIKALPATNEDAETIVRRVLTDLYGEEVLNQ